MEYIKREDFVKKANAQNFVYNKFMEALNILKDSELVKSYDGKTINKRFTDKVNPMLPKGVFIEIKAESYTDKLNIHLYFNRYGNNQEVMDEITDPVLKRSVDCLSYNDCDYNMWQNSPSYGNSIDTRYLLTDRMFNHQKFLNAVEQAMENIKSYIDNNQRAIDEIEITYKKYEDLKKHVQEVLNSIPLPLRQYINISNPLV